MPNMAVRFTIYCVENAASSIRSENVKLMTSYYSPRPPRSTAVVAHRQTRADIAPKVGLLCQRRGNFAGGVICHIAGMKSTALVERNAHATDWLQQ